MMSRPIPRPGIRKGGRNVNENVMPEIDLALCDLCGDCVPACPRNALAIRDGKLWLNEALCAYCGDCEDVCPKGAIALPFDIILSPPDDVEEEAE
jgi:ferredoxin